MRLIAHRGASAHAPENTMAAFRLALEMGAEAVELDVHLTKDGELVVIHDEDVRRVARRRGKVRDLTLEAARGLDVGSWFSARFAGERVPRLEEVLDLVEGRAELHVEIKKGSSLYPGIEGKLVRLIQERRARSRVVVSSFDHKALYSARSLDPGLRLGYLLGLTNLKAAFREIAELKAESLNLSLGQANARRVRAAHERGLKALVYTVNTPKAAARLARLGVDGIFSNFPELAASLS